MPTDINNKQLIVIIIVSVHTIWAMELYRADTLEHPRFNEPAENPKRPPLGVITPRLRTTDLMDLDCRTQKFSVIYQ